MNAPVQLVKEAAARLGLITRAAPIRLPPVHVSVCWHERFQRDPAHQWARERVFHIARPLFVIGALVAALALTGCGGRSVRSVQSSNGGSSTGGNVATGGALASGGSAGAAAGGSADPLSCTQDTDCRLCLYTTAPTDIDECEGSLACCGGQVMNDATCAVNQAAFQSFCSGQDVSPPLCPCVRASTDCALACRGGECGFYCTDPATAGRGAAQ